MGRKMEINRQYQDRLAEVLDEHFVGDPWVMIAALHDYLDYGMPVINEKHGRDAAEALGDLFLGYPAWDYVAELEREINADRRARRGER
jgi:hypothetical protein